MDNIDVLLYNKDMKIGIAGLPNVGKSTLFKALTRKQIDISNYPFCTIDPNVGVVNVPDERLEKLATMSNPKKVIPAVVEFVDIAGLVKGASKGEGLGNQFLANIREVDAIVHVVRSFASSNIIHVEGNVNPQRDIDIIEMEFALKDLETIEKRMVKIKNDVKNKQKDALTEMSILKKYQEILQRGNLRNKNFCSLSDNESCDEIPGLQLLSTKPVIYLVNGSWDENPYKNSVEVDLLTEAELSDLSTEEANELRDEEESGLDKLVRSAYSILNMITFFTTGEDETRAWQIKKETLAPQAAGTIHTDFEKGFIKAEVINWQNLINLGGWGKAREVGKLRIEGKYYTIQDGDVIEYKISG